ncbi:hypothetical protein ACFLSF_01920 [Candidatus Bipolaricaulota bacterium]
MHKKLLLVGLLVVGVAILSGCDLLDQIIAAIGGGGPGTPGGGTTSPGVITSVAITYHLNVTLSERDIYPKPSGPSVTTSASSVGMTTGPRPGSYDPVTRKFTASWNNAVGDYSNTHLELQLNETEEYVEYIAMRQTQSNVWFAWTFVNEIRAIHILDRYGSATDNPRTYEVDGVQVQDIVELLVYKGWSTASGNINDPIEWINSKADIIPSLDNIITIEVYR